MEGIIEIAESLEESGLLIKQKNKKKDLFQSFYEY